MVILRLLQKNLNCFKEKNYCRQIGFLEILLVKYCASDIHLKRNKTRNGIFY